MIPTLENRYAPAGRPMHAVFLAGMFPLFLGAALGDAAYAQSFDIQWNNFASWLLVGALLFSGIALVLGIIDLLRPARRVAGAVAYVLALLALWVVGIFNALIHARDAWGSMPAGLVLSVLAVVLACAVLWLGFRAPQMRSAI